MENGLLTEQLEITDAALRRVIAEYTREAGVRTLERQIGAIARKVAARVASNEAATCHGRCRRRARIPGTGAIPTRNVVPDLAAGRRHRPRVDRDGRRRALHRGRAPARRQRPGDPDRPAGQRHAGIGARGAVARTAEREAARHLARVPQQARRPRPRPGRRHSKGWPVRGRNDGDRDRLGSARRARPRRRRDDRRDHALRPRASGRRHPREDAGRAAAGDQDGHPARAERAGSRRAARRGASRHDVPPRRHARAGARDLASRKPWPPAAERG